jgi:hypothetical protein
MGVERQFNWLGQARVDVPHLRTIDSSIADDFDIGSGLTIAGGTAVVVAGFVLITTGVVGTPAPNLHLQVASGIIVHYHASENGSIFQAPANRAPEQLVSTNPRVFGSFTSSQLNYVGLDLRRLADSTTADLVEFLDADTLQETPKTVPLARTLDYRIVISTADFTSQPNVLPIALVQTDASNNVVSVTDARNIMWRLGVGGTNPNPQFSYGWPQGRQESLNPDGFSGGDKAFGSLKDAIQGIESRLWELGGGPYWYSPSNDRQVKFTRNLGTRFPNGDNFEIDGSGHILWQGLSFVFCNGHLTGSGTPLFQNDIADQVTEKTGLTDIAVGECIYVDIDEQNAHTGLTALVPIKVAMASLGTPTIPGSRWVFVWRNTEGYFTRDSQFGVGTIFAPASTTANGVVEINTAAFNPTNPVVVSASSTGIAVAPGLSRGSGSAPQFSTGTLFVGFGANDTSVAVGGGSAPHSQTQLLGFAPAGGTTVATIQSNAIEIGGVGTVATVDINAATSVTIENAPTTSGCTLTVDTTTIILGSTVATTATIGGTAMNDVDIEPQASVATVSVNPSNIVSGAGTINIGTDHGSISGASVAIHIGNITSVGGGATTHINGNNGAGVSMFIGDLTFDIQFGNTSSICTFPAAQGNAIQVSATSNSVSFVPGDATHNGFVNANPQGANPEVNIMTSSSATGNVFIATGASSSTGVNIGTGSGYSGNIQIGNNAVTTCGIFIGNLANTTGNTTIASGNVLTLGVPSTGTMNLQSHGGGIINIGSEFAGSNAGTTNIGIGNTGNAGTVQIGNNVGGGGGSTIQIGCGSSGSSGSSIQIGDGRTAMALRGTISFGGTAFGTTTETHLVDANATMGTGLSVNSTTGNTTAGTVSTCLDSNGLNVSGAALSGVSCTDLAGTATVGWSGTFNLTSGSSAFQKLLTVTFFRSYAAAPKVVFSMNSPPNTTDVFYTVISHTDHFDIYILNVTGSTNTVGSASALQFYYMVMG